MISRKKWKSFSEDTMIIKARAPASYKEIMKKTKEFERQFRQQNNGQAPEQTKEASTERTACTPTDGISVSISDDSLSIPPDQFKQLSAEGKRKPACDRIRVPVS